MSTHHQCLFLLSKPFGSCFYICSDLCYSLCQSVCECTSVSVSVCGHGAKNAYMPTSSLTFLGHADLKALLQAAVLAAVACDLVDLAVLVTVTGVHHVLLDAAPKEALQPGKRASMLATATRHVRLLLSVLIFSFQWTIHLHV